MELKIFYVMEMIMRDNSATPPPCPPPADNPADFAQTAATVPAGQVLTQARALLEPGSPDDWDFNLRWARALLDRAIAEDPNTPPPMTQSGRPAAWANVRDELYPRLRGRGLTDEAALAAAERGADAAIVEARLITLAEARRWGRPFTGERVETTPTVAPMLAIEGAVVDIARMAQIGDALAAHVAGARATDREKAFAAVLWFLPRFCEAAEALEAKFYRAFDDASAAKRAASRSSDGEGQP